MTFCQKNSIFDTFWEICQNHCFHRMTKFPKNTKNTKIGIFRCDGENRENGENRGFGKIPQKWGFLENGENWENGHFWKIWVFGQKWENGHFGENGQKWGFLGKWGFLEIPPKLGFLRLR